MLTVPTLQFPLIINGFNFVAAFDYDVSKEINLASEINIGAKYGVNQTFSYPADCTKVTLTYLDNRAAP